MAVVACLLLAAPAALAGPGKGRNVVGGTIADATEAPWAVWVVSVDPDTGALAFCSGSLIAADTVLTAAHCAERPAADYRVWAGWSPGPDGRAAGEAFDQSRRVRAIRIHPGYVPAPSGALDDVAVLQLQAPFAVTPRVAPIALAGAPPDADTALRFYGYGSPRIGELRGFAAALRPRWSCSGAAVWLCGSSSDGMACRGDSGGGLVAMTAPPRLVAVVSVGGITCQPGGPNGYADVTAPEIARWIAGEEHPPVGPRRTGDVPPLVATPFPDGSLQCGAGSWSGTPNLRFTFSDEATGAVLQDSATAAYLPTEADAGRTIRCVMTAFNDGGFAQASPDPLTVPEPWGLIVVDGMVTTRVWSLSDGRTAATTFTNIRGEEIKRIALEQLPVRLPALPVGAYRICLEVTPGGPFTAWRECASATVDGRATTLVKRAKVRRRGTRFVVTLTASGPAVGRRVTATWLTARCRRCPAKRLGARTRIQLRARRTVRSPAVPRGRELRLRLTLPALSADGGRYAAGTATFVIGRR